MNKQDVSHSHHPLKRKGRLPWYIPMAIPSNKQGSLKTWLSTLSTLPGLCLVWYSEEGWNSQIYHPPKEYQSTNEWPHYHITTPMVWVSTYGVHNRHLQVAPHQWLTPRMPLCQSPSQEGRVSRCTIQNIVLSTGHLLDWSLPLNPGSTPWPSSDSSL